MKDNRADALARFQRDTAEHTMEILHDDGLYRHLKFSKGGSSIYRFDLITCPGFLAVTGDMGEYVFQRLQDMFEFFRTDGGKINPQYWAEKCQAADRHNGLKDFDRESAERDIREHIAEMFEHDPVGEETTLLVLDEINFVDGEQAFYASCYEAKNANGDPLFPDFEYIPNPMDWGFHYLWICHAIAWGIQQYDAAKAPKAEAAPAA